ncbi:MAG: hypothetical protein JWL84_1802 [Rhodospirillales bacterium]|nr:hypothetical protein [Rhodospirillales bacterium]
MARSDKVRIYELFILMKSPMNDAVKSAVRTIDILEFVAGAAQRPTFSEIAAALNIPKSSLFHLLATLSDRGYLRQVEQRGGYELGHAVDALAQRIPKQSLIEDRVVPILKELSQSLNETCGYYERRDDEVEVVRAESGRQALVYLLSVGDRVPLYAVSAGKAILSTMDDEEVKRYVARTPLRVFTPRTVGTAEGLTRELLAARGSGFAYSREEYALGVVGIATPLRFAGVVVGAISTAVPTVRYNEEIDGQIRRELAVAAAKLERVPDQKSKTPSAPSKQQRQNPPRGAAE